jgi:light-regulated signal transduction histidine kinase (bacteriophytochrome)
MPRIAAVPKATLSVESQDIDEFIYLMNHDVRASVRALMELPHWIVDDLQDAGIEAPVTVMQSIELMNRHTARLDQMLVDLLAYSRIGKNQCAVHLDINAVLDKVVADSNFPVGMNLTRNIAHSHVLAEESEVTMLLTALIGNAVKHHHEDTGNIWVSTQTEGEMIRLTVCDDGPGIPEELYVRAMAAMTTLRPRDEVEGTGIGLANVCKIATRYGGHVILSSAESDQSGLQVDFVIPHGCCVTA